MTLRRSAAGATSTDIACSERASAMDEREDFDRRLGAAQRRRGEARQEARQTAFGQAFRLSTEMVAGVLVGGFIGWVLDGWLGTGPWLLIVFFFLGVAAGILNAVRAAREMNRRAGGGTGNGADAG